MWVCDVEIFEAEAESGSSPFATRLQPATLTQTDAEPVTATTDPDNSSNSEPAFDGGAAGALKRAAERHHLRRRADGRKSRATARRRLRRPTRHLCRRESAGRRRRHHRRIQAPRRGASVTPAPTALQCRQKSPSYSPRLGRLNFPAKKSAISRFSASNIFGSHGLSQKLIKPNPL
jgi:hypothetical protein